jgi:hypothetical protein
MIGQEGFEIGYHPFAEKEYVESQEWYNENQIELCNDFMKEVEHVLDLLEQNPYTFQIKKFNNREAPVETFPFLIIYKIIPVKKEILVMG